jgi:hypothetical protein
MRSAGPAVCPVHGAGGDPSSLVGARLEGVVASRFVSADGEADGQEDRPSDIWLVDDTGACTWITAGSDWCLRVEASSPTEGYGLGDGERVEVARDRRTPFERHVGERVISVQERWEPQTGRVGLLMEFESGGVACEIWAGDLRLLPQRSR